MKKKLILTSVLILALVTTLVGCAGEQGPKGDQGPMGPQGIQGERGPEGPEGPVGLQGEPGPKGPAGAKGATGSTGAKGEQGEQGERGPRGAGSRGPTGATGPQGPAGPMGPEGPEGPAGSDADCGDLQDQIDELIARIFALENPTPKIDGVISPCEWTCATSFSLVPSNPECSRSYTAYVTNDAEFLYVAFDYDIAIGSDFLSVGVYKEGAFEPETINAPGICAYTGVVPEVHAMWDIVLDSDGNGVFWESGGDYSRIEPAEDCSSDLDWAVSTATEMAIPLADLGIAVDDIIKLSLGINEHPWTADEPPVPIGDACWHGYPEGADPHDPLGTFATIPLE